jgi:hypothetical protein
MMRWFRKLLPAVREQTWGADQIFWVGLTCFMCGKSFDTLSVVILSILGGAQALLVGLIAWRMVLAEQIRGSGT